MSKESDEIRRIAEDLIATSQKLRAKAEAMLKRAQELDGKIKKDQQK